MLVYLTVSRVNSSLSFNNFRHPVKFNLCQNSIVGKTFGPSSSLSTCIFPEYSVGVTISMLECRDGKKESAPVKGMRHKCILV